MKNEEIKKLETRAKGSPEFLARINGNECETLMGVSQTAILSLIERLRDAEKLLAVGASVSVAKEEYFDKWSK